MANWMANHLKITGQEARVQELVEFVQSKELPFDFEKIVPVGDVPDSNNVHKAKWGCKWNACHGSPADISKSDDQGNVTAEFFFDTAWSKPGKVLETLAAKFSDLSMLYYGIEPGMAVYTFAESDDDGGLDFQSVEVEEIYTRERKIDALKNWLTIHQLSQEDFDLEKILDQEDLCFDLDDDDGYNMFENATLELVECSPNYIETFRIKK